LGVDGDALDDLAPLDLPRTRLRESRRGVPIGPERDGEPVPTIERGDGEPAGEPLARHGPLFDLAAPDIETHADLPQVGPAMPAGRLVEEPSG
jgi:hypothetical protein